MKRLPTLIAVVAAGSVVVAAGTAPSATATTTGSAHSAAAQVSSGSGLNPQLTTTGLAALLSTVLGSVADPLLSTLTSLPQQLVTQVATGLTGSGLQADNPSAQQARPSSGSYPTCGQGGWTAQDCYQLTSVTVPGAPLVSISSGAVQGYATGDSQGYVAAAHVANVSLSLLGISIGSLGVVDASASCGTTTCSAAQSLTGGSLLGGIAVSVSNGQLLANIGGVSVPSTGVAISGSGVSGTASLGGNLLTLRLSLSLTQLLTGVGLSGVLGALAGVGTAGTTVTLTVTVGPGTQPITGSTAAWGLEVGVDLAADVKLSVLGLAGVEVTAGGGASPDLLDLKLAYATATAGGAVGQTTQWVPPGLI